MKGQGSTLEAVLMGSRDYTTTGLQWNGVLSVELLVWYGRPLREEGVKPPYFHRSRGIDTRCPALFSRVKEPQEESGDGGSDSSVQAAG